MPNDINSVSPSIRDFLLNRNLILSDTITQNGLTSVASGLGGLSSLETLPNAIQASENIEVSSEEYRDSQILKNPYSSTDDVEFASISNQSVNTGNLPINTPSVEYGKYIASTTEDSVFLNSSTSARDLQTLKNRYISSEDMVNATIVNNSFAYGQTDGGYLDEHGDLNLGGPSTDTLDAIGSILSQKGFGFDGAGLTSQFDIRSSLAGRVLGATGAINDTQLGIIGGQQLLLALGQKAIFNTQKEILGKVNLQPFSLMRGSSLINPDYTVTVRATTGGKILDKISDIAGFELPSSVIDPDASIFQDSQIPFYNFTHLVDQGSVDRNKTLIKNTGKGQMTSMYNSLNQNTYKPDYTIDGDSSIGVVDPLTYEKEKNSLGLTELNDDGSGYMWGQDKSLLANDDTLLGKTRTLFNDNKNLRKVLFTNDPITDTRSLETSTPGTYLQGTPLYSKGSGVLNQDGDSFCRTWTSTNRYDSVNNLQKNTGLINYSDRIRNNIDDSVLGQNGFAKVSPYRLGDTNTDTGDVKKYMFSIENLAWSGAKTELTPLEIGNGDLTTGTKGRIMWFPPYGINFTDTTAVDWDTTKFIGRGEPIYTYNSTERSGTLEFQIIIDYPDYMNNHNISSDEIFASIAAGCTDYNDLFTDKEMAEIEIEVNKINKTKSARISKSGNIPDLIIYFDNDISVINSSYEDTGTDLEPIGYNYGLNRPWSDDGKIHALNIMLNTSHTSYIMRLTGEASVDGITQSSGVDKVTHNQTLSEERTASVKQWILDNLDDGSDSGFKNRIKTKSVGEGNAKATKSVAESPTYSLEKKKDRKVTIQFEYNSDLDKQVVDATELPVETPKDNKELTSKIKSRFYDEGKYFKELLNSDTESDKLIYKSIKEKVGFFQPAFHSTTPEGFNARLTFLQQCTRQGPTDQKKGSQNLAFGMPPICILRIGDFYHTKIAINNLALTYDPLVWDLNPEGVGVQPMIAKATLSFKFIGGSALQGPINKLQNAISFNYFANTEIYDNRADRIVKNKDGFEVTSGATLSRPPATEINTEVQGLDFGPVENNQEIVVATELAKPVEDVVSSDKTQLTKIRLTNYDNSYVTGEELITFDFKFTDDGTPIDLDSLGIKGKLILYSNDPQLQQFRYEIGYLTASKNTIGSFNINNTDNTSGELVSSSTTNFSIDIIVRDAHEFGIIFDTINTSERKGRIKLSWDEVGVSNTINL